MAEKGTGDTYVHISKVPFPAFTICPGRPYKGQFLILLLSQEIITTLG